MQSLYKKNKVISSKGWISALKIEENMRKRDLVPTYLHLYHYAGNNPVRYIDPDGLYVIDEENKTIYANLNDKMDLKSATKYFKNHPDYRIEGGFENTLLIFQSFSDIKDYLSRIKNLSKQDYDKLLFSVNTIATLATEEQIITYVGNFNKASKAFGHISSFFGIISLAMEIPDFINSAKSKDAFGLINFGVDGILYGLGLVGGIEGTEGTAVSLYIGSIKEAADYFDKGFEFLVTLENLRLENYMWDIMYEEYGY